MKKDRLAMAGICLFVLAGMIYIALNDTETDNSKNQGKNEAYESRENAAADEVTDTVRGAEEDAISKEETTEPNASADQEEEPEVSQTRAEEILFADPEDIGEYQWVYDYADFSGRGMVTMSGTCHMWMMKPLRCSGRLMRKWILAGNLSWEIRSFTMSIGKNTGGCCKITGRSWIKRLGA